LRLLLPGSRIYTNWEMTPRDVVTWFDPARDIDLESLEEGIDMDTTTMIRVVAGVLFVVIMVVLIQRRRTRVK
jgi:hypothetical protein